MKKVLALALTIIIILISCNYAFAEEYEKPILFRGIEWGANYQEALKGLPEGVRMWSLDELEYWYSVDQRLFDEFDHTYKGYLGCYTFAWTNTLENVKVAGYEIENLYLYFVYLTDENGLLVKDEQHTALVFGSYKIQPKDPEAAYSDLVSKLTSLYGDVDVTRTRNPYTVYTQNIWKGADGTMVSLLKEDNPLSNTEIMIIYSFEGADTLMEKAYNALILEESINSASNTDGL